ncbi:hypothetical protein [Bradyrhizobium sp. ORS 86]|uniref:hypothetical protein n=1 Tax=Bradyrhizobium sp. ORS 86 TaxID=1685970 RepID=UPI00388F3CD7
MFCLGLGAAGVYFGASIEEVGEVAASREAVAPLALSGQDKAALSEIQSGQREVGDGIAELKLSIDAQRADLKRIADQIAALALRIDLLQKLTSSASSSSSSFVPRSPDQAVANPAKRMPRSAKPQGPVSVGGAPLTSSSKTDEP